MTKIKNVYKCLPCSLFLTFTFFVFGPMQIYLTNINEFWFKLIHILPSIISFFAISTILLSLIYVILIERYKKYFMALIFGIGFALYIQGNFINLNYGILDGTEIDWASYGFMGILNSIIWIACITAPVILTHFYSKNLKLIIKFLSLFILAIQLLTTGLLLINTDYAPNNTISVTKKDMLSLSPEKNEIIFILDTFDASYMNEILEKYPEYKELFSDFTYYSNTLGAYPTTKGAVPHILTGERYDNSKPFTEYIEHAYDKTILYDTLISEGYDIGIYANKIFMSSNCANIFKNVSEREEKPSSYAELGLMMYKSTAFNYFPHILKSKVWYYSGDFDKYKDTSASDNFSSPFSSDDVTFYNDLITDKLSFNNDKYAFRLYHLNGVHPPYTMTSDIKHTTKVTTAIEESLASLNIVLEYVNQLKEANVYDKTSIIIMSDHGGVDLRQNPILMIKQTRANQIFTISTAPVSYDDLLNTILYLAIEDNIYQPNIFSWTENDLRVRKYMNYFWDDSWNKSYLPDIYEYTTSGAANDESKMHKTGKLYSLSGAIENYFVHIKQGEVLKFGGSSKTHGALVIGFSGDEGTHIWSLGKYAKLSVILDNKDLKGNALALSLKFKYIYGDSQRIKCYINGTYIGEKKVRSIEKPLMYLLPSNLVPDSGVLEIEFEYPDAFRKGNSLESRMLAFAFDQMTIDYEKNLMSYITVGKEKSTVDFSKDGNSDHLINDGWYDQEPSHRWSSDTAEILFYTKEDQDYLLTINCKTYEFSGKTHVMYNGKEITVWDRDSSYHTESVILPAKLYNKNGKQVVKFITDDAKSPQESGQSKDSRVLGLSVRSMVIEKIMNDK